MSIDVRRHQPTFQPKLNPIFFSFKRLEAQRGLPSFAAVDTKKLRHCSLLLLVRESERMGTYITQGLCVCVVRLASRFAFHFLCSLLDALIVKAKCLVFVDKDSESRFQRG